MAGYVSPKTKLAAGVTVSTVIAIVTGVQKTVYDSVSSVSQSASSIQGGSFGSVASTEGAVSPDLVFAVLFVSFNLPVGYSLVREQQVEKRYLAWYTLPVVVYLGVTAVFRGGI
jgi:hypothetical protein